MEPTKLGLVFPGMAMQSVGIGQQLYAAFADARDVFQEVNEALQFKLSDLMFSGDPQTFNLMEHKQPGLVTVSMAIMRVLEKQTGGDIWSRVDCVAGHSFGEYAALCATGSLKLADTVRLMRDNARNMDENAVLKEGKMLVLLKRGLTIERARKIAAEAAQGQVCVVANVNSDGQIVISGHNDAIDRADAIAKASGIRCMAINQGVPAHSPLMKGSVAGIRKAVRKMDILPPRVPFVTNRAQVDNDPASIRKLLPRSVVVPVKWREAVGQMCSRGVQEFVELGPMPLLTSMIRQTVPHIPAVALDTPEAIDGFLSRFVARPAAAPV